MMQPKVGEGSFSPVLDPQSENVLYLLSLDSRRSVTGIARRLGLWGNQVIYRINTLREMEALRYATIVNAPLGKKFTVLIRLKYIDSKLVDALKKDADICILRETTGEYDLHIICDAQSDQEFKQAVSRIKKICGKNVDRMDVLPHDWMLSLGYKSFCQDKKLLKHDLVVPRVREITEDERTLLLALKKNPSASYRKLSPKTGIHYNYMQGIVDGLLKDGLIQSTVFLDYSKLELQYHHMALQVSKRGRSQFEKYIQKHPRVHFVKPSRGQWDYIISICSQSIDDFINTARGIRSDNTKAVKGWATMISKLTYSWADRYPRDSV